MTDGKLGVFISHSTKDLTSVNSLTWELEFLGLEVFVAHRDITPTEVWRRAIIDALKNMEIFIAYITQNFKDSEWCDQESGIAYFLEKKIIPLIVEPDSIKVPYGFLNEFQKLDISSDKRSHPYKWDQIVASDIFDLLHSNEKYSALLRQGMLNKIPKVSSYGCANSLFQKLPLAEPLTKEEFEMIVRESNRNNQIYEAGGAKITLKNIVGKHGDETDIQELQELKGKINY